MKTPCFFCDIQLEQSDEKFIIENEYFFARYTGDVAEPHGGIRNIFPDKGDYTPQVKQIASRKKYIDQ